MEPARNEREHGSRNLGRVSCGNRGLCERSGAGWSKITTLEVSRIEKWRLTCERALPGKWRSTGPLAGSYDDRGG